MEYTFTLKYQLTDDDRGVPLLEPGLEQPLAELDQLAEPGNPIAGVIERVRAGTEERALGIVQLASGRLVTGSLVPSAMTALRMML